LGLRGAAGLGMRKKKTRKLLVGLASLTLVDIAVAAAGPLPADTWSGFYLGGHAGYRWADANFSGPGYNVDSDFGTFSIPPRSESYRLDNGIVGIQAGYNYMITPKLLIGVEGDWDWGSSTASNQSGFTGIASASDGFSLSSASKVQLTWEATVRGRVGVVNGPWLLYGTGGIAFTHVNWTDTSTGSVLLAGDLVDPSSSSNSGGGLLTGVALGAGVEYMLTSKWIGRVEYLFEDFGSVSVPFGFVTQTGTLDLRDVTKIRFGVSYKFGP
jgi:opacity protein-like surface antigen